MALQRTIPFADGMDLGLGIDDLTGSVGSLRAVSFAQPAAAEGDEGMVGHYDTSLVYSSEQMYSALGVDITAEGRYGLFSAEGKFSFAEQSHFTTSSTFLVARAEITNAFRRVSEPVPVQDAQDLIADGKRELFRTRYGDLFIRGVQTGGEYVAVLSITSKTEDKQRRLGLALKASFDGLVASGSVGVAISSEVAELRSQCEIRTSVYQRGGSGEQVSFTGTIEEVMARLKTFATAVKESPKAYSVQAASYDTLVFPDAPSPFDIQVQREVLEDCMRKRLQLQTLRNDIEVVELHPEYYVGAPDRGVLAAWSTAVTDQLNALDKHVRKVTDSVSEATFFPLVLPAGLAIPPRLQHSSDQVEVFSNTNYNQDVSLDVTPRSQVLAPGSYDDASGQLGVGNDQISSLTVPAGMAVRAYEHAWFQGASIDFRADTPALATDWNERISSLIVYRADEPAPVITSVVVLDFPWNRWLVLGPGQYPDLAATSLGAGTMTTLLVPRGVTARLWDSPGLQGSSIDITTDVLQLPPEWDNRAASLEVSVTG